MNLIVKRIHAFVLGGKYSGLDKKPDFYYSKK